VGEREPKSFAEILGNVRPESEKVFGYRQFMGWTGFLVPVVFGGAALGLLVFFALGGSNSDKGGADWFLPAWSLAALAMSYVFGWRFGRHLRIEGHVLTWRAPYRQRVYDLDRVQVRTITYPWLGTATIRFSDGSSKLMGVNTTDWNDFLVSLDRRQGTELSKANRVRLGLFAWGEGYYQE